MMYLFFKRFAAFAALVMLVACGDNAYDGKTGLLSVGGGTSTTEMLSQINTNVLVADSEAARQRAAEVQNAVAALAIEQNASNLAQAQAAARALFLAWKRVEAVYMAKEYDDSLIDLPAQIDYFNQGNIDVPAKLDTVFAGTSSLEGQLYQSATQGVTALEYTLFGHNEGADVNMTQRRADAAVIMADYIASALAAIADFYAASGDFVSTGEDAVGIVINQLIDSANKLKEWRIGNPAGYTTKYAGDPDADRFEYVNSYGSLAGIRAILSAQLSVMQEGLEQIAVNNSAASEGKALTALLEDAIAQVDAFDAPIEESPASAQSLELYDTVDTIQDGYTALINALNFKQDIIDSDGD